MNAIVNYFPYGGSISYHITLVLALSQESRGTSQNLSFPAAASSDMADDGAFTLTCERVE